MANLCQLSLLLNWLVVRLNIGTQLGRARGDIIKEFLTTKINVAVMEKKPLYRPLLIWLPLILL